MNSNPIIAILEKQEEERKQRVSLQEWGVGNRNRLVSILESEGAVISNNMWDLLLFNINGLRINEAGKVCYLSFYKPSKRILTLLARYNNVIIKNFDEITKC